MSTDHSARLRQVAQTSAPFIVLVLAWQLAAQSEAMDELPLDRGLGHVLRHDRRFECLVLLRILEGLDDGFRCEAVPEGIASGLPFSVLGSRTRTLERVTAICLNLSEGRHARCESG
jgi:hypothetical protein